MSNRKTPTEVLQELADDNHLNIDHVEFAKWMDENDPLKELRNEFNLPDPNDDSNDVDCTVYFCGNSLGIQPKRTQPYLQEALDNWRKNTIGCHFSGFMPAAYCDEVVQADMARLVGANADEVAVMNGLSVNLHFMLVSFYKPTAARSKILIESHAFPSDHYVAESQIRLRGFDPSNSLLLVSPDEGEETVSTEKLLDVIEREGEGIDVIMLPGVHYFTGQVFDMKRIVEAGHRKGCKVGFDLAHAVGNVCLELHAWQVDFACWCTYKYLNSGPGCIAGAFMHDKHRNNDFDKLLGWWGHNARTRFDMSNELDLTPGVGGYRVTNPAVMLTTCLKASLDIFNMTSMEELSKKSFLLTGYLEYLLKKRFSDDLEIITPQFDRGCQLSVRFKFPVEEVFAKMRERGIRCDVRKPSVVRLAPVPLYNSFADVFNFSTILDQVLLELKT